MSIQSKLLSPTYVRAENEGARILVVEGAEETRDGIQRLLERDGYLVDPARNEQDAVAKALHRPPALILVSPGGAPAEVIAMAGRIRNQARLGDKVPIVNFCVASLAEGEERGMGDNIYLTRPDNFNQLRALLYRLLPASDT
jgi:DNA-binding response OmpR family regulator